MMKERGLPVLFENKEDCCGCSLCFALCPVGAISMEADEYGFLYPMVIENRCVRCYKCVDICAFKK